jgi:hypothetical protein
MQWLWSWLLLEALMTLHSHKVMAAAALLHHLTSISLLANAHQVALAGPTSLHVIARVASSFVGQLRMMAGLFTRFPALVPCVRFHPCIS